MPRREPYRTVLRRKFRRPAVDSSPVPDIGPFSEAKTLYLSTHMPHLGHGESGTASLVRVTILNRCKALTCGNAVGAEEVAGEDYAKVQVVP